MAKVLGRMIMADNRTYWERGTISEQAKKYLNTHFLIDLTVYDVIRGYRADDSYFSFAQDFMSNAISLKQLSEAMFLGKLGEQIVLKSRKAFSQLQYVSNEKAPAEVYFTKKTMRDKEARKEYRMAKTADADMQDIFMLDIMREGIENGDARLR